MCDAPFHEFLALIISDSCSDFPQHLLIDIAHRRAQRRRCIRRIEIEDAHKIFMFKVVVRVKSAAAHQGIADADLRGMSKGHLDVEFIIFLKKRILKDVENIALIVVPVFLGKALRQIFDLRIQRVRSLRTVVGRQHGGHSRNVLLPKLPQIHISRMRSFAGIRHIEYIAKSVAVASGVNQGNALGAATYKSPHGVVPHIILGTGRRIRSLRMNHDLLMICVLIQSRCCFQKGLPAFQTARYLALCLLRHAAVFLQFTCHRLVLLSLPFIRAKEKKYLFRYSSYK